MKILLPVDGSAYTNRMIDYVHAHPAMFGAGHTYVIATVVAPIPAHAARYVPHDTLTSFHDEQAEQVLAPLRAVVKRAGWNAQLLHVVGHPAEAIATLADRVHADLIVLGSHGHTALAGLLLGSVTTGVLARSKVPVLIVR